METAGFPVTPRLQAVRKSVRLAAEGIRTVPPPTFWMWMMKTGWTMSRLGCPVRLNPGRAGPVFDARDGDWGSLVLERGGFGAADLLLHVAVEGVRIHADGGAEHGAVSVAHAREELRGGLFAQAGDGVKLRDWLEVDEVSVLPSGTLAVEHGLVRRL